MSDEPPSRKHRDFSARTPAFGVIGSRESMPRPVDRDERDVVTKQTHDEQLTPTPVALGKIIAGMRADGRLPPSAQEIAEEVARSLVPLMIERHAKGHRLTTDRLMEVAAAAPSSDRMLTRVANLETWRIGLDEWRLKLTGVADTNGRMGNMDRVVAKLREDVGTPSECVAVRETVNVLRNAQRKSWAAVVAAFIAVAGSAWGLVKSRDENIAAATRATARIETLERDLERIRVDVRSAFRLPFSGVAQPPDSKDPTP